MTSVCTCSESQLIPIQNAKAKRKVSPLRADPTRTTTLRSKFLAEMNRRFAALKKAIWVLIVEEDALGKAPPSRLQFNAEKQKWRFVTDDKKIELFHSWLNEAIQQNILSVSGGGDAWTAKYVDSAYKQGLLRAWTDAHKKELALSDPSFMSGTKEQFIKSSFSGPEAVTKLKLLQTRAYEGLRGITSGMSTRMGRVLADGLAAGKGLEEIAKDLTWEVTGVSLVRARTLARTEIMHAHAEGQLDSYEALGAEEIGVMAEWSTAGDDRVCPVCAPLEGVVMSIKEARGLIPRHPNCRCTFIPANVGEKTTGQKRTSARIASAIFRSLKAETGKTKKEEAIAKSTWTGAERL